MTANEWDNHADDWDSNEDVRDYAQRAFDSWEQKVAPLYPSLSECRVLDFGCGTGLLTEKLATHCSQIVAIDTSEKMIEALRSKLTQLGSDNVVASKVALNAESIRANGLLCRVGAYYHDIGKINKPPYFIENQMGSASRHDQGLPSR